MKNQIEIIQASINEKQIIKNLFQLYKYDTSDFTLEDPTPFGQYEYNYLDHYWTSYGVNQEGRKAYLIRVEGQLAGFALINNFSLKKSFSIEIRSIAEFFYYEKVEKKRNRPDFCI